MLRMLLVTAGAAALAASGGAAQAKALKWMDTAGVGLPGGGKIAVVSGNPAKDGPFVVHIKMPAGYMVPPHHHPTDEVVRVITAGTLSYGMGDTVDKSNVGSLTKGYHITLGAGMNHYAFTADPITVQVSGNGPFEIVYVNPADDPRNAGK